MHIQLKRVFWHKGSVPLLRAWLFFSSMDEDLIFLGQASMGEKNTLKKSITYKKYIGKCYFFLHRYIKFSITKCY